MNTLADLSPLALAFSIGLGVGGGLAAVALLGWLRYRMSEVTQAATREGETRTQALMAQLAEQQREADARVHALTVQLSERERDVVHHQSLTAQHQAEAQAIRVELTTTQADRARLSAELKSLQQAQTDWAAQQEQRLQEQLKLQMLQWSESSRDRLLAMAQEARQADQEASRLTLTATVQPLKTMVAEYRQQLENLQAQALKHTGALQQQVDELIQTKRQLVSALSHNKGRGDWGELELTRLLEDSGLIEGMHFDCQQVLENGSRPDVRIHLPDNRVVFVDAKALQVDLNDFAAPDETPDIQAARHQRLAASLKSAIRDLSSKQYHAQLSTAVDMVVLYVPRESMLSGALLAEPGLFEDAYRKNVVLAGPLNLIAILKCIRMTWSQAELSDHARHICDQGRTLFERSALFVERLEKLGKGVESVVKLFNEAQTSFWGNQGLVKPVQRLAELGCAESANRKLPEAPRRVELLPDSAPLLDLPAPVAEPVEPAFAG